MTRRLLGSFLCVALWVILPSIPASAAKATPIVTVTQQWTGCEVTVTTTWSGFAGRVRGNTVSAAYYVGSTHGGIAGPVVSGKSGSYSEIYSWNPSVGGVLREWEAIGFVSDRLGGLIGGLSYSAHVYVPCEH